MKIRKLLAVLCALAMLSTMVGSVSFAEGTAYTAGTYTGTAKGFEGDVTVTLTVDENAITDVQIIGENETPAVGGAAMTQLQADILAAQSAEVDGVAGATFTSNAVKTAATAAIAAAKGEEVVIPELKMAAGTYTGYGKGFSQTLDIPVTVTVDENTILSIDVDKVGAAETTHLLQTAIDLMVPRILEYQSLSVDAITGATTSSNGVKAAIADALAQAIAAAGTDANAIQNFYQPLDLSTGETETIDVDVLVVGMGGTGTAAAMKAAEAQTEAGQEVSVLAIEKSGTYGGTSSATTSLLAFNSSYTETLAGNDETEVDMRASHRDDVTEEQDTTTSFYVNLDDVAAYLTASGILGVGNEVAENYWKHVFDESGNLVDWLIDHGFYFGQPRLGFWGDWHTQFYYCDGAGEANLQKIHDCFDKMVADYVALGGEYMLETEGYELIYDADTNTVTGVKAHNLVDGTEYVINAKAVILATGGFGGNSEMMQEYNGGDYWLWGMAQNDGKMVASAISIGAKTLGMVTDLSQMWGGVHNISTKPQLDVFDTVWDETGAIDIWRDEVNAWSLNDVPNIIVASYDSMWVNTEGNRVVNEDMMWAWPVLGDTYYTIVNQDWIDNVAANGFSENHVELFCNDGYATFPLNTPIPEMDQVIEECEKAGIVVSADSITELAEKLGMDPATLEATYNAYNEGCEKGEDALGKNAAYLKSIEGGKLYAFTAAPRPYSSIGGLYVNYNMEVINNDDVKINGLYAGGTDALGATAPSFGGELQLWAYMSGNVAGQSAVDYVNGK